MKGTRKRVRAANVYLESPQYAVDNEELDKFRESDRTSRQCLKDIADAINSNYDGWRLNGDIAGDIINQYGINMVKYVLATVIKEQEWDRRYTTDNRQWLEDVPVSKSEDVRRRLTTSVHPGLLDMFMTQVRKRERGNGVSANRMCANSEQVRDYFYEEYTDFDEAAKRADELGFVLYGYGCFNNSDKNFAWWNKKGEKDSANMIYAEWYADEGKQVKGGSPYPTGSVMDDAWMTWQNVLKGRVPEDVSVWGFAQMFSGVMERHYPDIEKNSDKYEEESFEIAYRLLRDVGVKGIGRQRIIKSNKVRAMYEALDGMSGESDYVSTGDIVDDGGYSYEIVSVLDVKEDSGYEVALAEAVNADRGMTEFLVLLDGDVDWKDDSMEAAREFYDNTDYSELDNIGEEDVEMEDSFDMYEADDDIVAAYRESGSKDDDKIEARKRARERCAKRKKEMQAKKVAEMRKRVHANIEKSMKAAKNKDREKPVSITAMAKKDGKSVKWNVEIKASLTEKGKRYSVQGVRQLAEAMGVKPNELDVAAMYEACKQNGYNALAIENGKAKFGKVQAEKDSAAQKGFVRKHMGCTIHDMGDVFVVTNEHGKNIGEERTISGCEGLIEDYVKSKQTLNRKDAGANGSSKMQRRKSRMNADYEGARTLQQWLEETGLDGADIYDSDFDLDGTYVDTIVTPEDNYDKFVLYVCNNVEVVEKHAEDSYATVDFSKFIRSHMQVFLQWLDIDEGYYRDGLEDDDLYEYIIDQIITALSGGGSESQYREFMRLADAGEDAE